MRDKIIGDVHIDFIRKYNKTKLGTNSLNDVPVRVGTRKNICKIYVQDVTIILRYKIS